MICTGDYQNSCQKAGKKSWRSCVSVHDGRKSPASSPSLLHPREHVVFQPFKPEGPAWVTKNELNCCVAPPSPKKVFIIVIIFPISSQCFLVTISAATVKKEQKRFYCHKVLLTFIILHGHVTSLKSNLSNHHERKAGLLIPPKTKIEC